MSSAWAYVTPRQLAVKVRMMSDLNIRYGAVTVKVTATVVVPFS
jgi:hypothetical protein